MISPVAVALALAFWTPYHGGRPIPCTGADVQLTPVQAMPDGTPADGWAYLGVGGCTIHIYDQVAYYPVAEQCSILAHEWGHAYFGLPHSDDPHNVMAVTYVIPAACHRYRVRRR